MKRVTLLLVFLIVWGSCQVNLVPLISSRVDGTVLDKETRQPIAGAKVELIIGPGTGVSMELSQETVTNAKGYFRFDLSFKVPITAYFKCEKEGYIPLIPEYYLMHAKKELFDKVVNLFEIHQGKIKRSIITLEKGGTLKGKVFKKDSNGVSPYSYIGGFLMRSTNPDTNLLNESGGHGYSISYIKSNVDGEFEIKGIETYDNYYIIFLPKGRFNDLIVRNISVNRSFVQTIEHTIDLTNQTGIKGTVRLDQNTIDATVMIRNLSKTNLDYGDGGGFNTDDDGIYSILGVTPGKYEVIVRTTDLKHNYEKRFEVDIIQGITKIIDITLTSVDITGDYE